MYYYNSKIKDNYFSSALLVSNRNHLNETKDIQQNNTTSPYSRYHSIESSSMNNCISKDLLRRLNSISPLEKRFNRKRTDTLDPNSQEAETQFRLMGFNNDSKDIQDMNYIIEGSNLNMYKVKLSNQNQKSKRKHNEDNEYTTQMFGRRGWVCDQCYNFNYESRNQCNRCKLPKIAKQRHVENKEIQQNNTKNLPQYDWLCSFCFNFNFFFSQTCDKCKLVNPQHSICNM